MVYNNLLSIIIFLPLICSVVLGIMKGNEQDGNNYKSVALFVLLVNFVLGLMLFSKFDSNLCGYQFVYSIPLIEDSGVLYHVGVDGISILLIILTTFLMPIAILVSWKSITHKAREYMISFLVLETMIIGVFTTLNIFMFFLFFEGVLIPMFFIIGIWGGKNRVYASLKFFLYTLAGSVFMLIAIMFIYVHTGFSAIEDIQGYDFASDIQLWLWLAFFMSFAVKTPMLPVHSWLPDAHVEAPTAGSVVLAGILLKMGGYGFLRILLPCFPKASILFQPFVMILSVVAVLYSSFVAFAQTDMKKLIAYSSIAHMGFVTFGLMAFSGYGLHGAIFQMVSHGIISAGLFGCIGILYHYTNTREMTNYGGISETMPLYTSIFTVLVFASIALPGTSGFIGEFLVLLSAFKIGKWLAFFTAFGIVLSAVYALWMYKRIILGKVNMTTVAQLKDLGLSEKVALLPIVITILLLGLRPNIVFNVVDNSVNKITSRYKLKN